MISPTCLFLFLFDKFNSNLRCFEVETSCFPNLGCPFLFPVSKIVLNHIPLHGCKDVEGQELPGRLVHFCIQRHFKEQPPLRQKCQTRAQTQET